MSDSLAALRAELATASRILSMENVLDAFGHVSVRHPTRPDRYLISRYSAGELVTPEHIVELTLDSEPVGAKNVRLFSEVPIHGCIYQARPDVQAVCHHHADAVMPFCIAGIELLPVFHIGATTGEKVPFWDSRDEFGDTRLVVTTPEEGRSLARALGSHWMVLMRRHGATVAARSLREAVFRTVYSAKNAELQLRTMAVGVPGPLTAGEVNMAGNHVMGERSMGRAWEYWTMRLAKYDAMTRGAAKPAARPKAKRRKPPAPPRKRR
jgi:ribulose-5-phosphate 4-epimerase/fuculose-1-phosphate aldolase